MRYRHFAPACDPGWFAITTIPLEPFMTIRPTHALSALCLLVLISPAALASEPGNMMKMTTITKMEMPGMGVNMPPMTHTADVCVSAKKPDITQMMKSQKDCKVSNYQEVGDTVSYHIECTGKMQMSGDGKFQLTSDSSIHGEMHANGEAGTGQKMTIDVSYNGQKTGACDYTPPSSAG